MKIINLSEGKINYSQRNNELDPINTCVPTSLIMMLDYSGIPFPEKMTHNQPEDSLTYFCRNNPEVIDFYQNNPDSFIRTCWNQKIPANQVHAVMEFAVNKWLGFNPYKIIFTTNSSLIFMVKSLLQNKAVVLLGDFPYKKNNGTVITLGHAVCLVGFSTKQEDITIDNINIADITNVIIDDPFGDYRSNYSITKGNDIVMPMEDFISIIRNKNSIAKWCYCIKD